MFDYKICKFWLGSLGIIFFITACGPVTAGPEVKPTLVITPPLLATWLIRPKKEDYHAILPA